MKVTKLVTSMSLLSCRYWFGSMIARVLAACALLASLAVGAAPTLTYYSGGVATTKSSWTASAENTAAGIGGCNVNSGSVTFGTITINGGTVTATETDGRGCGIGAGEVTGGTATVNEIIITGGTVTASASTDKDNSTAYQLEAAGAGIGAGASTACGNVTIAGGHITANGGTSAAGIGAGTGADADCGTITFIGGTVEAERGGSTAQNVGNGANGECSNVVVTGGSLVTDHGAVTPAPSGIGNEAGHAVTIQNDNWTVGQAIEISGVPAGYGTNDIIVSENKSIVVWVPDGDYPLEVNDDWYVVSVGGANGTAAPATLVDVPSVVGAEDLVYTGSPITGVPAGEGYTITGYVATDPGHYTATLTPAAGCLWSDHTMTPVQVEWYIAPAVIDPQYGTVTYDDVNDA